jgi:hypothetical protein
LKHQSEKIAADKDVRVQFGFDAGVVFADGDDDTLETEVDACGEEGGCDG